MKPMHGPAEKAIGRTIAKMEYEHTDKDCFSMRIHFTDGSGLVVGFNANSTAKDESGKEIPMSISSWSFAELEQ